MALTVLFRLLFIAYAEDRDLLPYRTNEPYRVRSLKRKAQELAEARRNLVAPSAGDNHWQEVFRLFRAVEIGNSECSVPAYDGGLFAADPTRSPSASSICSTAPSNRRSTTI